MAWEMLLPRAAFHLQIRWQGWMWQGRVWQDQVWQHTVRSVKILLPLSLPLSMPPAHCKGWLSC